MSELRSRSRPSRHVRRRRTVIIASIIAAVLVAATVVAFVVLSPKTGPVAMPTPSGTPSQTPSATPTPTPTPTPTFDKAAQSIDDPASYWVVVNKQRPLNPLDYYPSDLVDPPVPYGAYAMRQAASDAVVAMFAAFLQETGQEMESISGFRSYDSQVTTYQGWVDSLGQAQADLQSARPGHSEHQTGLAIDVGSVPAVCSLEACFADTPQGQWLAANGWRFGFIVRYPADKTPITGFMFEPWHMRYIGVELATEMHNTGITTLEEFFGLPAAPDY